MGTLRDAMRYIEEHNYTDNKSLFDKDGLYVCLKCNDVNDSLYFSDIKVYVDRKYLESVYKFVAVAMMNNFYTVEDYNRYNDKVDLSNLRSYVYDVQTQRYADYLTDNEVNKIRGTLTYAINKVVGDQFNWTTLDSELFDKICRNKYIVHALSENAIAGIEYIVEKKDGKLVNVYNTLT